MAEKREVLEYLRNRQKAAEIEAKVNGINLWVLIGAIALVLWQLLGTLASAVWKEYEVILRVLIWAGSLCMFMYMCRPSRGIRNDIRFSSTRLDGGTSPTLRVAEQLLLLFPPALFFLAGHRSLLVGVYGIFCVLAFAASISLLFDQFADERGDTEKFPAPRFVFSNKVDKGTDLALQVFFILVSLDQFVDLYWRVEMKSGESAKVLGLIAALYLLALVAIQRSRGSHSLVWTYELETDLLIGSVSADVALRRIENRALGPRLQDVMDRFLDNVDSRFAELESLLSKLPDQLAALKGIPAEYKAERTARVAEASKAPSALVESLTTDIREFGVYLEKLAAPPFSKRPGIAGLLGSLSARHKDYVQRGRGAKAALEHFAATASRQ